MNYNQNKLGKSTFNINHINPQITLNPNYNKNRFMLDA